MMVIEFWRAKLTINTETNLEAKCGNCQFQMLLFVVGWDQLIHLGEIFTKDCSKLGLKLI